jgi:Fe-Mn family superoxide dismutase
MLYTLPDLPYPFDALEPHIDARTMELHHDKHHGTYVANLNKALEGHDIGHLTIEELVASIDTLPEDIRTVIRNNGGGHANHSMLWNILSRKGGGQPRGDLAQAIDQQLGGFDRFVDEITKAALGRFGSGWAWLSLDHNRRLIVESTPNQDSPLMQGHIPIMGIDVWEHAYYLKYQNRRADYLKACFNVIDWSAVTERYQDAVRLEEAVHA